MPGLLAVTLIEIETFQDLQGHQGHQTLPARRDFPDIHASVIDVDGVDPLGAIVPEVRSPQVTAAGPGMGVQALGQCTAIKAFAASVGQFLKRACLGRVAENLPGPWRPAFDQKGIEPGLQDGIAMGRELVHRDLPLMGNHRRQRKAVPGQADGRLQQLGKGQLAKASG